ncbi:spore coat associated protein CotJA [Lachnoclostridium pacaense]|nr:spore coat associated protein CotJA [Lachnoclostridium pacaense]
MIQFPVAMAFVPWQQWQPTYVPEQGLEQGTIFPDLNLPFHCGRCGI